MKLKKPRAAEIAFKCDPESLIIQFVKSKTNNVGLTPIEVELINKKLLILKNLLTKNGLKVYEGIINFRARRYLVKKLSSLFSVARWGAFENV